MTWFPVDVAPYNEPVLTYGNAGHVIARRSRHFGWHAEHCDQETGEPWLGDTFSAPLYWRYLDVPDESLSSSPAIYEKVLKI